jgi:3-hydroxybutyryl-CoA dehydrogenase
MIQTVLILGAGQMGRGIAQVCLEASLKVILVDSQTESLDIAKNVMEKNWKRQIEKNLIAPIKIDEWKAQLVLSSSLEKAHESHIPTYDLAIEAATENLALKLELFKQLEHYAPKHAILASNTSSISITQLAAKTHRSDKVIGIHFMNPVPVMQLVEVIKGFKTSEDTYQKSQWLVERLNKTMVTSKDAPGFIVNRILMPMINEAFFALNENIGSAKDIDVAMKLGCHFPMGPLELADFIGLDTCLSILNVLYDGFGDSKYRPAPLLKNYVLAGRLGRKTRQGVFDYESK